jgi:hypothetical protein
MVGPSGCSADLASHQPPAAERQAILEATGGQDERAVRFSFLWDVVRLYRVVCGAHCARD